MLLKLQYLNICRSKKGQEMRNNEKFKVKFANEDGIARQEMRDFSDFSTFKDL